MPPPEGRAGNIFVYIITCLFLVVITVGGAFLVLYITLPESAETEWFPIAGMALVGIPWLFWIMTCLYRTLSRRKAGGGVERPTGRAPVAPPATTGGATVTTINEDSVVDSPGGMRRLHFGAATVTAGIQEAARGASGSDATNRQPEHEADGDSHATTASSVSNEDGSALTSRESELPLFAMSLNKK